jgi:hypothetical protein
MIDVKLDGEAYQEMHVDGGAMAQLCPYPPAAGERIVNAGIEGERRAFEIWT